VRPLKHLQLFSALGGMALGALLFVLIRPGLLPVWDVPYGPQLQRFLAWSLLMAWFAQLAEERKLRALTAMVLMSLGLLAEITLVFLGRGDTGNFSFAAADLMGVWFGYRLTTGGAGRILQTFDGI